VPVLLCCRKKKEKRKKKKEKRKKKEKKKGDPMREWKIRKLEILYTCYASASQVLHGREPKEETYQQRHQKNQNHKS
jgi:hypothetical protein